MYEHKALQQLNLQIPQDIGICGPEDWDWDNDKNWPTMLTPSFTTLYVPTKKMGYKAAELLLEIINDTTQKQREVVLECELRVRSSTLHLK